MNKILNVGQTKKMGRKKENNSKILILFTYAIFYLSVLCFCMGMSFCTMQVMW